MTETTPAAALAPGRMRPSSPRDTLRPFSEPQEANLFDLQAKYAEVSEARSIDESARRARAT